MPFKDNELVYLSTKNISFSKGIAQKLIPKFIGPYKVLHDFRNNSFQLELPPHLKRVECIMYFTHHSCAYTSQMMTGFFLAIWIPK